METGVVIAFDTQRKGNEHLSHESQSCSEQGPEPQSAENGPLLSCFFSGWVCFPQNGWKAVKGYPSSSQGGSVLTEASSCRGFGVGSSKGADECRRGRAGDIPHPALGGPLTDWVRDTC